MKVGWRPWLMCDGSLREEDVPPALWRNDSPPSARSIETRSISTRFCDVLVCLKSQEIGSDDPVNGTCHLERHDARRGLHTQVWRWSASATAGTRKGPIARMARAAANCWKIVGG